MSMSQRLSKLYQEVTVKGEDLSHLTLEELSAENIKEPPWNMSGEPTPNGSGSW